jgi:superfamily I DNA/RNA helicase
MRALLDVKPTPEQLAIISRNRPGIEVIRGAAGSGKTTTALLRLRALIGAFVNRRKRQQSDEPVRILVLTYNRTLMGYIEALAQQQFSISNEIDLQISTFAQWSMIKLGRPALVQPTAAKTKIEELGAGIGLPGDFLTEEVEYVLSRFLPENINAYLTARRDGRGTSPRVERSMRQAILNEVIDPYQKWKGQIGQMDWNDLAVRLAKEKHPPAYDIIIADETQDFSANQIRAIKNHLADGHSLTFILDSAQRIYARGFTWQEVGVTVRPEQTHRLKRNYRNTVEIARFASSIINNINLDDDATMPDFSACERHGPKPIVLKGKYSAQVKYVIEYIHKHINLSQDSVAVLHPRGGGWFNFIGQQFRTAGLDYVEISRQSEWPQGPENIAFSTLHSAKGLEFDHVIILGLNAETLQHGSDEEDDRLVMLRRLLAMGVGRARKAVILGYNPDDTSKLISYFDPATYESIDV